MALAAGCFQGSEGAEAGARLIPLTGLVRLERGGEAFVVDGFLGLVAGDVLSTGPDGIARIAWAEQSRIELAPKTRVRLASSEAAEILRGSVLVVASQTPTIRVAGVRITASDALFRVDRELSTRIGVYRGSVRLPGFSAAHVVPRLRQVVVLGDGRGRSVEPLQVRATDLWDARLLAGPIEIGSGLVRLQRGLAAQMPGSEEPSRSTIVRLLPDSLRAGLSPELVRDTPPAELVVASGVSVRAARRVAAPPTEILQAVVDLRDAGASWTLVAAEWHVRRPGLATVAALSGRVAEAFRGTVGTDAGGANAGSEGPPRGRDEPSGSGDGPSQGSEGDPPNILPVCDGLVGVVCDVLEDLL